MIIHHPGFLHEVVNDGRTKNLVWILVFHYELINFLFELLGIVIDGLSVSN